MVHLRETYRAKPGRTDALARVLSDRLIPACVKHGAALIGWWVAPADGEMVIIWDCPQLAEHRRIIAEARRDPLWPEDGWTDELVETRREEVLEPMDRYGPPRHTLAVSGFIADGEGRVLLVRTRLRSDTWELPGGQVEAGEDPVTALVREIREETGIEAEIQGLTGVYYSTARGRVCNLVFRGVAVGGRLSSSPETLEAAFVQLRADTVSQWVTRPHFQVRVTDALGAHTLPYETYRLRPYARLLRLSGQH